MTPARLLLLLLALALAWPAPAGAAQNGRVIAHRSASACLQEHTLASYRLAIQLGADYLEPDLALTRDGARVTRAS